MSMNKRLIMFLLAVFLLMVPTWANAQRLFQMQAADVTVEVLPESAFEAQFGNNPEIPRTDAAVIALAQKLYPPRSIQPPESAAEGPECGEYGVGLLFAALQNPAISDATRLEVDRIIRAALPTFDEIRTIGHYKFYYCRFSGTPDDRVTDADIDSLATYLNSYWTNYTTNFTKPKHYESGGLELIDVWVYYLGTSVRGQTDSTWNRIDLNSKLCVKNAACKRRTTSAHELFHRVEYAYGYTSGTANMSWIAEGTARWSQKFTNISLRDYMEGMNGGLDVPDKALITGAAARSYDACHYWVWLQRRAGTYAAIKDVWYQYSTNGKNAKLAVGTVVKARGLAISFDAFTREWNKANYVKDFATGGLYDYDEDSVDTATGCGHFFLSDVPRDHCYYKNVSETVKEYGADYYEFTIDPAVTRFKIQLARTKGACDWALVAIKNGAWKIIYDSSTSPLTWDLTFAKGTYDKMGLIVAGRSSGATYTVKSLLNGGFEQAMKYWTGDAKIVSSLCGVLPTEGHNMVDIFVGGAKSRASVEQPFLVSCGPAKLSFDYNVLSESWYDTLPRSCGSFSVILITGSGTRVIFSKPINTEGWGDIYCGYYEVLAGWRHVTYDVSDLAGSIVTIKFKLQATVSDTSYGYTQIGVLVDNIKLE